MNEWLLIAGMALVTFGLRYPLLAILSRRRLPAGILQALKFIPASVLAAIIAPAILIPDGSSINWSPANPALIASLAAAFTAWRWNRLLLTILVGMGVYLGLRWGVRAF